MGIINVIYMVQGKNRSIHKLHHFGSSYWRNACEVLILHCCMAGATMANYTLGPTLVAHLLVTKHDHFADDNKPGKRYVGVNRLRFF